MKLILVITLAVLMGLFGLAGAYALLGPSKSISVSATVPNLSPEMDIMIKELTTDGQDPSTGATVTTMTFGNLTHFLTTGGEAGVWYAQKYYCVFMYTAPYGKKYQLTSLCTGLASGGNALPAGSLGLTGGYAPLDRWNGTDPLSAQGALPGTAVVYNTTVPAISANAKMIYKSEAAASARIVRAFYAIPTYKAGGAIPFTGWQNITLSQPPGTYTGTVTLTIATY